MRVLGGIKLSGRGLNKTAVKIGTEMVTERDQQTEAYFNQPLPRQHALPECFASREQMKTLLSGVALEGIWKSVFV